MRLRKSKALKFFAILLFSFEMMAPALVSCFDSHASDSFFSLIFEESNGESEGEGEEEKAFTELGFDHAYLALTTIDTRQISWVEPYKTTATQPRLFTLLHTYRI